MATHYLCVHCDHRFEDGGDEKPRCPKCLRVHGVEKLTAPKGTSSAKGKAWMVPVVAIALLAVVAGGYAFWAKRAPDTVVGDVPLAPLDHAELAGHLRKLQVNADSLEGFLDAGEPVEALAARGAQGKGSALAKAEGIFREIRARSKKGAFVQWPRTEPRDSVVMDVSKVAEAIAVDGAQKRLYPLELAALAVAAMRAEGVTAMVAEVYGFPNERSPADPSGRFGYFVAAAYEGETTTGEPKVFDVYGGRSSTPEGEALRVLNDVQVIGAAIAARAIHRLVREQDPRRALEGSGAALRLDPRSPVLHAVQGACLLISGGVEDSMSEFEAAAQMRPDAVRRTDLARLYLGVRRDHDKAAREVGKAIEEQPDYAAAHGVLAAVQLSQRETELARASLERAEALDPDLPELAMLWANYYLGENDLEHAIERAQQGLARRPDDVPGHLLLAQIYRQAGRYDAMRRQVQTALAAAPEAAREALKAQIGSRLGPTALDPPDEEPSEDGAEAEPAAEGDLPDPSALRLGEGSRLLGEEGGGGGTTLRLGDPSNLRLGGGAGPGGGDQLRLRLQE